MIEEDEAYKYAKIPRYLWGRSINDFPKLKSKIMTEDYIDFVNDNKWLLLTGNVADAVTIGYFTTKLRVDMARKYNRPGSNRALTLVRLYEAIERRSEYDEDLLRSKFLFVRHFNTAEQSPFSYKEREKIESYLIARFNNCYITALQANDPSLSWWSDDQRHFISAVCIKIHC